jgi:hypothetical protein
MKVTVYISRDFDLDSIGRSEIDRLTRDLGIGTPVSGYDTTRKQQFMSFFTDKKVVEIGEVSDAVRKYPFCDGVAVDKE